MRLTRKIMSVLTLGRMHFRSDTDPAARSTKKTDGQAKKQEKLIREQARRAARAGLSAEQELLRAQSDGWNG